VKPFEVPVEVHRIAIPAQSEVLDRVQAGERIAARRKGFRRIHEIHLTEPDPRHRHGQRTDVEHLDLAERRHMRHKPVDTRPHIHVPLRLPSKDAARDQQVLMKVVAAGAAAVLVPVFQTRHREPQPERPAGRAVLPFQHGIIAGSRHEPRENIAQRDRIQAERLHPAASRFRDPFDERRARGHVKPPASFLYDNTGASIRNPGKTVLK